MERWRCSLRCGCRSWLPSVSSLLILLLLTLRGMLSVTGCVKCVDWHTPYDPFLAGLELTDWIFSVSTVELGRRTVQKLLELQPCAFRWISSTACDWLADRANQVRVKCVPWMDEAVGAQPTRSMYPIDQMRGCFLNRKTVWYKHLPGNGGRLAPVHVIWRVRWLLPDELCYFTDLDNYVGWLPLNCWTVWTDLLWDELLLIMLRFSNWLDEESLMTNVGWRQTMFLRRLLWIKWETAFSTE